MTKDLNKPAFTEHRVPRQQGSVYARDYAGAGSPFVLMHGFPDNLHIYDDLIPYLTAAGRRVVAFDFLGFGASDKIPGATVSFQQQLGDLEAVVDALGLDKIVPVAHDSSGPAAINFTLNHPERVETLCIFNSGYDDVADILWPEMVTLFAVKGLAALSGAIAQSPTQFGWLLDWQRKQFQNSLPESQQERFQTVMGSLIADNFTQQPSSGPAFITLASQFNEERARNTTRLPELANLDIPVKVIWGEFDLTLRRMSPEIARRTSSTPPLRFCLRDTGCNRIYPKKLPGDAFMTITRTTAGKFAVLTAVLAAVSLLAAFSPVAAQVPPPTSSALAAVPTVKILAIGSFTAKATPKVWKPMLASEMRETARLYLAGKIDQWYVKQDQSGVVFVMNLSDPKAAQELLEKLPMGRAALMKFQFIPLGPLSPMRTLLGTPPKKENKMNINGCVALVTGANGGIGRAFVAELLKRGAGKVYITARDLDSLAELLQKGDARLVPLKLEVTDPAQVVVVANAAPDVTLLINNAGYAAFEGAISAPDLTPARQEMEVNYFGPLSLTRAFSPILAVSGGGAILNMLSMVALVSLPMAATYSASKAAFLSLTRSIRAELEAQQTLVVGVLAVQTESPMGARLPEPRLTPEELVADALNAIQDDKNEEIVAGSLSRGAFAAFMSDPKAFQAKMSTRLPQTSERTKGNV